MNTPDYSTETWRNSAKIAYMTARVQTSYADDLNPTEIAKQADEMARAMFPDVLQATDTAK